MTLKDVEKLAQLARLEISEEEKQEFLNNLESILSYVGQIQDVATEKVEKEVGEVHNVLREDTHPRESGIYTEKILKGAPDTLDNFFKVKKII